MTGQVEPQSDRRVGALLRRCRLQAGLDLAEASLSLHIRRRLPGGDRGRPIRGLARPVYAIGFVRTYAEYLGSRRRRGGAAVQEEIAGLGARDAAALSPAAVRRRHAEGGRRPARRHHRHRRLRHLVRDQRRDLEVAQTAAPVPEHLGGMLHGEARHAAPANREQHGGGRSPALPVVKAPIESARQAGRCRRACRGSVPAGATPATPGDRRLRAGALPAPPPLPAPAPPRPAMHERLALAESAPVPVAAVPAAPAPRPVAAGPSVGAMAMAAEPPHPAAHRLACSRADSWVEVRESEPTRLVIARLLKAGDIYRRSRAEPGLTLRHRQRRRPGGHWSTARRCRRSARTAPCGGDRARCRRLAQGRGRGQHCPVAPGR